MANFLSGGSSGRVNNPPVAATSLRIQNSVQGQTIPIVHGQNRVAGNLIDYWGFKSVPQSSGGGGKGGIAGGGGAKGSSTSSFLYYVSCLFGVCEGPINQIILGWNGKSAFQLESVYLSQFFVPINGSQGQAPWSYLTSTNPSHALGYSSLAYLGGEEIDLGNSPELQNFNWEVRGALSSAITEIYTISSPYTFTPTYFNLGDSVTEDLTIPLASPYTVQAAIQGSPNSWPVLIWVSNQSTIASRPYQIFSSGSCGVIDSNTGAVFTKVSSSPAAGQFTVTPGVATSGSVTGGLYTFNAADAGTAVTLVDFIVSPGVNYAYQPTGNIVSGSPTIGNISNISNIAVGQLVVGTGIQPGTVVQVVGSNSVTLSLSSISTLNGATFTFYGAALVQVLGTPSQGQFSLSAANGSFGQYLFSSADNGSKVIITDIPDVDPTLSLVDFLSNPRYGCGFPSQYVGSLTNAQNYFYAYNLFISPVITGNQAANTYLKDFSTGLNGEFVWSSGLLTFVPYGDTLTTANGKTYTPQTVQYSLGDNNFLPNEGTSSVGVSAFTSDDPVVCVRKRQSDAYNDVKVEFVARGNAYNPAIVEAQDDASINLFGLRPTDTKSLHFFCIETAALSSAQLQLGRQQIRNQYSFTVPWYYILLDPMDIIEITDTALGLNSNTVRILEITENQQDWSLTITAEDYLVGTGSTPKYGTQPKAGYVPNYNTTPGTLVSPVIFEPPPQIATTGGLEIWLFGGGSDNIGGYDVYVSLDGNTYQNVGRQMGGNRVGYTTTSLPLAANPDTVDTVGVDLSFTAGTLSPGTANDAQNAVTLCYLGGYPLPTAPTLSYVTGGSLTTATYYVRISYMCVGGEGAASAEDYITIPSGTLLVVSSPAAITGPIGWNVYVSTSEANEELQNTATLSLGIAWTLPTSGLTIGVSPPPSTQGYELISYEGAVLTSQYNYTLGTYLGRGLYSSRIIAHGVGTQFARLDGSQFIYPYNSDQVGDIIYVKLLPFNPWGGGQTDLSSVQPYLHVIQGPAVPGLITGFSAVEINNAVLLSWNAIINGEISGYDIAYGPVGGSIASAFLNSTITIATLATSQTTVAIPVGTWNVYIRGNGIVSGLVGPVSTAVITVTSTNIPVISQDYAPDWLGTVSGFIRHYTGTIYPDSTVLASSLSIVHLFETFCFSPVTTGTYSSGAYDTGFNDSLHVVLQSVQNVGPNITGAPSVGYALDTWLSGASDPNTFVSWTSGNVTARYIRSQLNETVGTSPSVITSFPITATVPSAITETIQGFSISNSAGTTLLYATYGVGPFHSTPTIAGNGTDGVLQSIGFSNITSTQCTVQGFVSGVASTGTCNITVTGE